MTKIDIYSGFLGAGKTTLIKKMIAEGYQGQKLVLIENEFGEIGIDGGFLQDAGINITEMNSGCICCSLVGDFSKALEQVIVQYNPDRVIIEPSGVGKLSDVIGAVEKVQGVEIGYTVAVADASKVKTYMKNFGEFYNNQIETAATIILSRTDGIAEEKLHKAVEMLREHNGKATVVTTPWDQLTGQQLIFAMEGTATVEKALEALEHEHHHHEDHHEHGEHCGCGHHHEHHHEHGEHCGCGHHHEDHHEHGEHCSCGHHHEDHHEHGEHCGCGHHHEHHHEHGEHCGCGHHHEHHHEHGEHCGCGHHHEDHHEHGEHCGCGHHHEDHHEHGEHCGCGHHHEHHHEHGEHCGCGHHHEDHHEHGEHCSCGHHHDHHADEVFASWGKETTKKFTVAEIQTALETLDSGFHGMILRAKGIVACTDGGWIHFDLVPGEMNVRMGGADIIGKLCVIGAQLDENGVASAFGL